MVTLCCGENGEIAQTVEKTQSGQRKASSHKWGSETTEEKTACKMAQIKQTLCTNAGPSVLRQDGEERVRYGEEVVLWRVQLWTRMDRGRALTLVHSDCKGVCVPELHAGWGGVYTKTCCRHGCALATRLCPWTVK